MSTIVEYAWKDYGILFKVSTLPYRKQKDGETKSPFSTKLQQNDIFSKHLFIFNVIHRGTKGLVSFFYICSLFLH